MEYTGGVAFRGKLPPRAEDFAYLERLGVAVSKGSKGELGGGGLGSDVLFRLELEHPSWGSASLISLRGLEPPPELLIDFDPRLLDEEREQARLAGSMVLVRMAGQSDNVLRDRKQLLRYLRAVMGDDGLVAVDHGAHALWSRTALDEELSHAADLDIMSLFTVHCLGDEDGDGQGAAPYWMHTHGLKELDFFDFDVLDPAPGLWQSPGAWDVIRALAFAVVEGKAQWDGEPFEVVGGKPAVRFVPAATFLRLCGRNFPRWAAEVDEEHTERHAVACDPEDRGLFGLRRSKPRPSSLLGGDPSEDAPLQFSTSASELMAERARATWPVFCSLFEEFAALELRPLVKLWYGGDEGPESREHLWFGVDACAADHVEATLLNEPWQDIGFGAGDRRAHDLERLSDWMILTPVGSITPRALGPARALRAHRTEIERFLREARSSDPESA